MHCNRISPCAFGSGWTKRKPTFLVPRTYRLAHVHDGTSVFFCVCRIFFVVVVIVSCDRSCDWSRQVGPPSECSSRRWCSVDQESQCGRIRPVWRRRSTKAEAASNILFLSCAAEFVAITLFCHARVRTCYWHHKNRKFCLEFASVFDLRLRYYNSCLRLLNVQQSD